MAEEPHLPPGAGTLVGRLARTGLGALQNRFELLALEWQQEKARLTELLVWAVGLLFLGIMGGVLLTATIIFLFPQEWRLYVAGGFTLLYFLGALGAWFSLKTLLKQEPFAETLDQVKKDRVWLDSFK
ncbi:MAG TPA: phage holin family protein [Candidatus Sulfotelmatobacter sp.]|nr:phage holin family protein [Candidatus Sulfotelmatobacter sp.]HWI55715.1 phage holin family protein [Bacillota bacterium]